MVEAELQVKNNCECDIIRCPHNGEDGVCSNRTCTVYKSCCEPGCKGCKRNCNGVKPPEKCKCRIRVCGCLIDCYGDKKKGDCKRDGTRNSCERCKVKCRDSDKCICYQCSCGTQCNGVICSCCSWCDPRNCSGGKCNGYVLGKCFKNCKCPETCDLPKYGKDMTHCKGHVRYDQKGAVWDRNEPSIIKCDNSHSDCAPNKCNKWARGQRDEYGNCVIKCKYCGTLCGQDKFRRCCYIAIPVVIIVLLFLIFRFMLPEKFQSMMTKIRAAFPTSPRRPSRSLSNLVGDKIPEEMNTDRYPAFRPRAYAGLS